MYCIFIYIQDKSTWIFSLYSLWGKKATHTSTFWLAKPLERHCRWLFYEMWHIGTWYEGIYYGTICSSHNALQMPHAAIMWCSWDEGSGLAMIYTWSFATMAVYYRSQHPNLSHNHWRVFSVVQCHWESTTAFLVSCLSKDRVGSSAGCRRTELPVGQDIIVSHNPIVTRAHCLRILVSKFEQCS